MATRSSGTGTKRGRRAGGRKTTRARRASKPARVRAFRLARDVWPVDVDLAIEVDPQQGDAYRGEVVHHLSLSRARRSIELHGDGLRVTRADAVVEGLGVRARVTPHPERETLELSFDRAIGPGEATLVLSFHGRLRADLRGLYHARAGDRRYAFTHLEAASARQFFPCFDEPEMKARFRLSVTTARANTVLSNHPVEKVEPLGNGRKTVHFRRTPPLSTYLLALAVGELVASQPTHCGETEIRIWHVPGKERLTAFGLEAARETLARLEAYFDLPYPYAKLDLVAVPDFEAGAMENAGAVFFRETLLLLDPETATLAEQKRAAEVICHELAHMWYGDLVTMAWWDDLWLNEAFATWMAFHVVDGWKPEWRMWNDFQHYRSAALGLDALRETHPIYTPVRTAQEATQNFDLITYEKGASVVRMLERYLGPDVFRAGVRRYIREHQEANATAADLWRALSEASSQDVEPMVRAWIEQPGFPLLRLSREPGRPRLRYAQERFTANPAASKRLPPATWPIPFVGRIASEAGSRSVRALLSRKRGEIELPDGAGFVYGNADEGGFFRPLHDAATLAEIAAGLGKLGAVERMGLLGHQWAIVRAGHARVGSFLDLALAFGNETDPDVLTALAGPLEFAARAAGRTLGGEAEAALRARVARAFAPAFAALGWEPRAKERDEVKLRRGALLALAGGVGRDAEVEAEAEARCERYLADRAALDPNLVDAAVAIAARRGGNQRFESFLAVAKSAATPQEERRFKMALAGFHAPQLVQRTLALTLGDLIATQDVAIVLARMLGNPTAAEPTWSFLRRHWTKLERRLPPALVTRPIDALPQLATKRARREIAAFFAEHPVATGPRAVRQALEQLDLVLAFDARENKPLAEWLGD